jgi:hypothetical protein
MMKRAIFMLALVTLPGLGHPAYAQRAAVAPWMTGERLVKLFEPTGPEKIVVYGNGFTKEEIAEHMTVTNRDRGQAYIDGVHDATEGVAWCYSEKYRPAPMELSSDVIWGLRAMPPVQLKGNAAELLADIWRKKWPCPPQAQRRRQ